MKGIVTKLILGSVASVALGGLSAEANVTSPAKNSLAKQNIISAKVLNYLNTFTLPPTFIFEVQQFNYSISLEDKEYIKKIIQQDNNRLEQNFDYFAINTPENKTISLKKSPYINSDERENIILGKHRVFWHNQNKQKYWGLTTVKTWGEGEIDNLSLEKLNYISAAPLLAPGTSALTVSGGSKHNFIKSSPLLQEVSDFQGGVTFHRSLASEVTMGLGFVYEDSFQGFSQLTYQPKNFPLSTTVSLLQGENGLDAYSHIKLKPLEKMVFNFYSDFHDQKFNFNWDLVSGLTLTADGNTKNDSLRAGAKLNFKSELFSLFAKAQLDNNNKLQWQVNSHLGNLQFKYATNAVKTNTEIKYSFDSLQSSDFGLALWYKNQNRHRKEQELAVWGWNIHSPDKVGRNYRWAFSLGYGFGSSGKGAIASFGTAIDSSLSLKLSYESISLNSEDTRIKLELKSR